jgi:TP901 family phage tail tape measure protein
MTNVRLNLEIATEQAKAALSRLSGAIDAAAQSSNGLAGAQDKLQGELDQTGASASSAAEEMGQAAARLLALVGASQAVVNTVKVYASFERTLSVVGSVANATGEDLERLEAAARSAGASTEFSATEAGEGLLQLARAGFSVDEAIAALLPSLNLATSDSIDLAEAATITSAAIKQFNLDANDAVRVADVLAGTSNKTDSSVRDIGEAFSYVAPVANALNVGLEETAAVIGILAEDAIKGSRAGTSFSRFLSGLNVTTEPARAALEELGLTQEDLSLKSNTLTEVLENLRRANIDAYSAEAIFGDVAKITALSLAENVDKVRELTAANLESAGSAETAAQAISDNLIGSYRELTGAIEEVQISIGESSGGILRLLVDTGTDAVRVLGDLETAENQAGIGGDAAAVGIGSLVGALGGTGLVAAGKAAWGAVKWLASWTPGGRAVLAISGIAGALYGLVAAFDEVTPKAEEFRQTLDGFRDAKDVIEGLLRSIGLDVLEGDVDTAAKSISRLERMIQGLKVQAGSADTPLFDVKQFQGISKEIDEAIAGLEAGAESRLTEALAEGLKTGAKEGVDAAAAEIASLDKLFEFQKPEDRQQVFGLLERALAAANAADAASRVAGRLEAAGSPDRLLEADAEQFASTAQQRAEAAIDFFVKSAKLSLLSPEEIAEALLAGVSDAQAKLDAVPENKAKAFDGLEKQSIATGIGDEQADGLVKFIRQQDLLSQAVGRSSDELEILRVQAEAFDKALALGLPVAVAFAQAIGFQVSQRQDLVASLKKEEEVQEEIIKKAKELQEIEKERSREAQAEALQRQLGAIDTLSQLNAGLAFDLKTLGLSSDQRRRVYQDELAYQAALQLGAEEGALAFAQYTKLADDYEFAEDGAQAAEFLKDSFTAFSVQATQDFDSVGDAFEQLMARLETQVLNATFDSLFQGLFQNLIGTTLGASLGGAFGFGSSAPGASPPLPPGGIGPVFGLPEGPKSLGAGPGAELGTKGYEGAGGYGGYGKGLDVSVTLGDKFDQMVTALQAIATKVSASTAPTYVPQAARGYEPSGLGLSDRQLADQARRRFGR